MVSISQVEIGTSDRFSAGLVISHISISLEDRVATIYTYTNINVNDITKTSVYKHIY